LSVEELNFFLLLKKEQDGNNDSENILQYPQKVGLQIPHCQNLSLQTIYQNFYLSPLLFELLSISGNMSFRVEMVDRGYWMLYKINIIEQFSLLPAKKNIFIKSN